MPASLSPAASRIYFMRADLPRVFLLAPWNLIANPTTMPPALICLALAAVAAACNVSTGVVLGVGNDIGSVKASSQDDCCSKCNAQGCACWTFHDSGYQRGTCWLHSACSPQKKEAGAISGMRDGPMPPTPPPSPQPGWYPCTTNVSSSFHQRAASRGKNTKKLICLCQC